MRILAPYDFPTENLRRALILLYGCHVKWGKGKLEKTKCYIVVCKESLMIRLYRVYTMLVPDLESQSPKWTSTVSTGRVGGKTKDGEHSGVVA